MESLNMSQDAEQAATDSVLPEGQSGVKRQVSADAFRALTMRLKGRAAAQVASAPMPEIAVEPATPAATELVVPAAIESVELVASEPAVPVTNEISEPTATESVAPAIIEPVVQAVAEPTAVEFAEAITSEPEALETAVPAANEFTEPLPSELTTPVTSESAEPAAIEPDLLSATDAVIEESTVEVSNHELYEAEAEAVETVETVETVEAEPTVTEAPLAPIPAMPTGGTKIILNASIKSTFQSNPVSEATKPEPILVEAIQPEGVQETELDQSEKIKPTLPQLPEDPLLAAINIVNAHSKTTDSPKFVEFENAVIPEIDVSLTETAEIALSQAPEVEKLDPSPDVEAVADHEIFDAVDESVGESFTADAVEKAVEGVIAERVEDVTVEDAKEENALEENTKSEIADPIADVQPVAEIPLKQNAGDETSDQVDLTETTGEILEEIEPAPAPVQKPENSPSPVRVAVSIPTVDIKPNARSGETAKALLDMMSSVSGGSQPQERALAADTLLQLVPRMMVKDLIALSERVCLMETPPPLLVSALINYPEPRVAGPLLQDGMAVSEQELLSLIANTNKEQLIMVAKRRVLSSSVSDALISCGDPSVDLTLVRNPGASLSHDSFVALCQTAKTQVSLQAPLATRGDTPPPIAFELFWSLPVELRRYILSRFLTDSATLDKILKLTQTVDGGSSEDQKFPPQRKVSALVDLIVEGVTDEAAEMMATLAGCNQENARRIIMDPDGEPLTVVFKAMGVTRAFFAEIMKRCANSPRSMLTSERNLSELQVMFDLLSFNKARTLLTYWDWAIEKTGPYTRHTM